MSEEVAKRHMAEGGELKIGEDSFNIKPLTMKELPSLMSVMNSMNSAKQENFMEAMTEEVTEKVAMLCERSIELSYPDWTPETIDAFVISNFMPLMTKVFEINDLGAANMSKDREIVAKVKRMQAMKNVPDKTEGTGTKAE